MHRFKRTNKLLCLIFALLMVVFCLAGCGNDAAKGQVNAEEKLTWQDFASSRVGVSTGSYPAQVLPKMFPDAEISEFNTAADMVLALSQGKIDICAYDASFYTSMRWEGLNISRLEEPMEASDYGMIFKKGGNAELRAQLNEFIAKIRENGVYDSLHERWFGDAEPDESEDPSALTGENGTLKIAAAADVKPFCYQKNDRIVGYDMDLLILFAREYGYKLDVEPVNFASILMGVSQGKYDLGTSGITITAERAESVDFSDPYHHEDIVFMITGRGNDTLERFEYGNLGVVTGSLYGGYSREQFPAATISEFNNFADVLMALKQGKVDGTMLDVPSFNSAKRTEGKLSCVTVPAYSVEIGFGFQKNEGGYALQAQMNEFLDKLRAEGRIDAMIEKWYGETEPNEAVPLEKLDDNSTSLRVSIDTTRKPFVYMYEGKPAGFEMEVLYLFCEEYDYSINFEDVSFASGLAGLAGGKYDLACGGLYMTPERRQSVNFSDPYMVADVVMVSYESDGFEGFVVSFRESFDKTFVREGRWKLIVEGALTTLFISFFAVLGGTLLGFMLYMGARSEKKILSWITRMFARIYSKLIAGTPTLVVLMILFYVIFGKTDMSGVIVAIIGFILTFGSFVYGQLDLTVAGVDWGQTEAAYALGYSRNKTFFRIVLPQAMKMFVPVYASEIIGLIKATSVVGYITVNDLTKMGDIIRSNTYEAFFPLIAVAVIYFLITWGVAILLDQLRKKTEPKRRKNKNILKGVVR